MRLGERTPTFLLLLVRGEAISDRYRVPPHLSFWIRGAEVPSHLLRHHSDPPQLTAQYLALSLPYTFHSTLSLEHLLLRDLIT